MILQLDPIADDDARPHVGTPPDDALTSKLGVLANLGQVPDGRTGPQLSRRVHISGGTDLYVVHSDPFSISLETTRHTLLLTLTLLSKGLAHVIGQARPWSCLPCGLLSCRGGAPAGLFSGS